MKWYSVINSCDSPNYDCKWFDPLSRIYIVDIVNYMYTIQANSVPLWDVWFSLSPSSSRNVSTQSNLLLQIINTRAQLIGFILQKNNNKVFVFPYNDCKIILISIRAELINFTYHNISSYVSGHLQGNKSPLSRPTD